MLMLGKRLEGSFPRTGLFSGKDGWDAGVYALGT